MRGRLPVPLHPVCLHNLQNCAYRCTVHVYIVDKRREWGSTEKLNITLVNWCEARKDTGSTAPCLPSLAAAKLCVQVLSSCTRREWGCTEKLYIRIVNRWEAKTATGSSVPCLPSLEAAKLCV